MLGITETASPTFLRTLALSLAALCIAPAVYAATSPLTLTCYNSGAAALTVPITSLFFDTGSAASSYFSVYTDIANFDDLIYKTFFVNSFDYYMFSGDMRTYPSAVTLESTVASVGMGGTYTRLTFSYSGLTATTGAVKMPAKAQTPEEKAKALAAFLARVPPPVASQK